MKPVSGTATNSEKKHLVTVITCTTMQQACLLLTQQHRINNSLHKWTKIYTRTFKTAVHKTAVHIPSGIVNSTHYIEITIFKTINSLGLNFKITFDTFEAITYRRRWHQSPAGVTAPALAVLLVPAVSVLFADGSVLGLDWLGACVFSAADFPTSPASLLALTVTGAAATED